MEEIIMEDKMLVTRKEHHCHICKRIIKPKTKVRFIKKLFESNGECDLSSEYYCSKCNVI